MSNTDTCNKELIRAIAHTRLHQWAYPDWSHLAAIGMDVYVDWRTLAPGGGRYLVAIDREHPKALENANKIIMRHVVAYNNARAAHVSPHSHAPADFDRAIAEAPDPVLAWWCKERFALPEEP